MEDRKFDTVRFEEKNAEGEKGRLKIFIGYASGVGKTITMLQEGNRRLGYGQDVVIGYVEDYNRKETLDAVKALQIIPRKIISIDDSGIMAEEMDVDAIIKRRPHTVLVDDLAHNNHLGSKNNKRYEDVEEILNSGINVITNMNIQHLESLNDIVYKITGIKVEDTIPDYIFQKAEEIVVVDVTPAALQRRLLRGNVFEISKVAQLLKGLYKTSSLSALRELALRHAAEEVDEDLEACMKQEGIKDNWRTNEKILVCIYPDYSGKKLIRNGARTANRYKCPWIVVYMNYTGALSRKNTAAEKELLESQFHLAKQLGAETLVIDTPKIAESISEYANENHISRIIIGYSKKVPIQAALKGKTVGKLISTVNTADILLVNVD